MYALATSTEAKCIVPGDPSGPPSSSSSNPQNPQSERPHLHALNEQGFVKIPNLLSAAQVSALRSACVAATSLARSGGWPHIRTLPKQFPPWPSTPPPEGIWGVQHLLHPDMPGRDVFAASYFNDRLLHIVDEILGIDGVDASGGAVDGTANGFAKGDQTEPLVMELYNLLVRPDSDFELRWHRDDIPPTATAAEEESALGISHASPPATAVAGMPDIDPSRQPKPSATTGYSHTQWNLALEPDDSLLVVPGTHARARTQAERDAGPHDELAGELIVHLEPGDAVFYDNDILHRGRYSAARERFTLHGSLGRRGFAGKRARNVLQHGVGAWIERCKLGGEGDGDGGQGRGETTIRISSRAEAMRENLVLMGSGKEVGYSQAD